LGLFSSNCSIVRYSMASFHWYSKRHSSRHCLRNLSLIRPTSNRTDPSQTCRCYRNFSKGWLRGSLSTTSLRPDFYQSYSRRIGLIIRRRQRCSRCFATFYVRLTAVILPS
jgi:hypothetical protein